MEKFEQPTPEPVPQQENDVEEKKPGAMSRRNFLKKLGIGVAAAVGTGVAVDSIVERYSNEQKYEREHTFSGKGIVVQKELVHADPDTLVGNNIILQMPEPDKYRLHIRIGDKEGVVDVAKAEYDAYHEGEELTIRYVDNGSKEIEVESLQK